MSFHTKECTRCGATAFELPDEDGRMICAVCGAQAVDDDDDDDCESLAAEYAREGAHPRHRPQVRGVLGRSVLAQLSERLAGASLTERAHYDEIDDDAW